MMRSMKGKRDCMVGLARCGVKEMNNAAANKEREHVFKYILYISCVDLRARYMKINHGL